MMAVDAVNELERKRIIGSRRADVAGECR